jgi:hypothetical protein
MTHMIFTVEYTELAGGHRFEVSAGEEREATVVAPSARLGLRMATAFMYALLVMPPDPLDEQFRLPSPPDGPEDRG